MEAWTQSFSDTGSFTFTGTHNPLRRPVLREYLPGDGLKAGPVQIHTYLGVAEIFTDNVFRTNTRRRSDFLTTIAPGAQAYYPFGGQHSFLLDYRAAQFLYKKFTENNVLTQQGIGHMKLNFPGGLKLNLQAGHVEGFDPRGSELDIQTRDITKWRATTFSGQTRLNGSRSAVRFRSRYSRWHYKNNGQDTTRDRKNFRADLAGFLKATSGISTILGAGISNNTYDENTQVDSFTYRFFTGLEVEANRLISGEVTVGYSILNFDRAPVQQPAGSALSEGGDGQKALTIRGNINWRPTSSFNLNFRPFRLIRQAAIANTDTFIQTGASLFASQKILNRLRLTGNIYYSHDNFTGGRLDKQVRWRMGLDYRTVKWLGFRLGYTFAKRFSNQANFDSYANTISVSIQGLL